jgi:tetratricopeptide (TPR) repeat protein
MNSKSIGLVLTALAIAAGMLWLIYASQAPESAADSAYFDGNAYFREGAYEQAVASYRNTLKTDHRHGAALRGLANSYVQLKRYDEGLAAIERAVRLEPANGSNYAIRGIIFDRIGRHGLAIADYEKSIEFDPDVAQGMPWLDRLLYNVQERPPTVADRLNYLKQQMALPESKRVLRMPEIDEQQRPYEQ